MANFSTIRISNNAICMNMASKMIFLLIIMTWIAGTHSWGPITHVSFCSFDDGKPDGATSGDVDDEAFVTGCTAPDALKISWPELHNLEFAAKLFLAARHHDDETK